jgi:hypothetical protein
MCVANKRLYILFCSLHIHVVYVCMPLEIYITNYSDLYN